jgi:SAM-dependent methyltransferase
VTGADWEERITRETNPAVRVEHEIRYRMAAPIIRDAPVWGDLGCGNGVAAAAALAEPFGGRAVLVDLSKDAVEHARRELGPRGAVAFVADLASEEDIGRVRDALLDGDTRGGTVTCFEVVEHLSTFVPLVELLVELSEEHDFTAVLSVPNDAFWSLENPFHQTMWGEGSFEELRRLLPEKHVVARQLALHGSAIRVEGRGDEPAPIPLSGAAEEVPTHLLVGLGPRVGELAGAQAVAVADLVAQRRWERQRDADLAFLQTLDGQLTEWRAYIHELEERLGLPRSGVDPDDGE